MAFTGTKINGHTYGWSSTQVRFEGPGVPINIEEINYSDTLEPGERRGTSPYVQETTRGEYSAELDFTLSVEDGVVLTDALGEAFMEKRFQVVVSYAEEGSPTITDTINKVRISGQEQSGSRGGGPLMRKFTCHVQDPILWNGKTPVRLNNTPQG